jgi:hypothetical protein
MLSLAVPLVVVPETVNGCETASSSAMKNDGLDGVVICEAVIAAWAAGATTSPPTTSGPAPPMPIYRQKK